jgi:hypothetical protein
MPAKSAPQYRLMQAALHGAKLKKKGGPSKSVAREFINKTPPEDRKMFAKGK